MAKPQLKSRAWNRIALFGSIAVAVVGFGGLFLLQVLDSGATTTLVFVVLLGILTFLFFAGPGIAFSARKRIPAVKSRVPGGTLAWIRAHLYLPILALVAAWVHASVVPFTSAFSSGKILFVLGVLVAVAGVARHQLIGVAKSAVNADVNINKIASGHSRSFRQLVADYKQVRRPTADIEADAAQLGAEEAAAWREIVGIQEEIGKNFPRGGAQSPYVRILKVARAAHAPLTIVLFVVLAFHVFDVLGGTDEILENDKTAFASANECADCHGEIFDQWASSSMAHAQTSTIMEAQLPVTLAKNRELGELLGAEQAELNDAISPSCVNCHAPAAARFVGGTELLPLDEAPPGGDTPISDGGDATNADGVSCVTCHTQDEHFDELSGLGVLEIGTGPARGYGTVYGPIFDDPNPLPVSIHDIGEGVDGFWDDPIATSLACGACHNVKVDLDGDGVSAFGDGATGDTDGDLQLDENELDNADGTLDDLILQTTFDEWQDYVAAYDAAFGDDVGVGRPLGCIECHMPAMSDGPVVDYAPGFNPIPDRERRSHTFIGVDYDLDPDEYARRGLEPATVNDVIAERRALLQSAVTLEVVDPGVVDGDTYTADVVVANNLLGHSFPTGFAFARQFWLEVSAESSSGRPVCLVPVTGVETACASGLIPEGSDVVPQCDPEDLARAAGVAFAGGERNANILFAEPLPAEQCDPWLANFQKILTDGDPDGDGVFVEVPYQSFLPDIVKVRRRMIDDLPMDALNPLVNPEVAIPYQFDTSALQLGEAVTVTATLRFRHLPPEFVRGLERELDQLDAVPESARIDADELVENLVITDVVTASSGDAAQLACAGPQNIADASILDCIEALDASEAVDVAAAPIAGPTPPTPSAEGDPDGSTSVFTGLAVAGLVGAGVFATRRRPGDLGIAAAG